MPIDAKPSLPTLGFELGIYAVGIFMLVTLWRTRRGEVPLVLASLVFAGALEATDIRTTHAYYYTRELVMIGDAPGWFPLAIAMAWALVLHTVLRASERLAVSPWQRPAASALLGLSIDLVLDPTVASARTVTTLAEICDATSIPHGSAAGLGLWVWCVPAIEHSTIWGIPYANFYAWGVVVLMWGLILTALRKLFGLEGALTKLDLRACALAAATGLCAYFAVWGMIKLYTPLVLHGVPEWILLCAPFVPGVVVLALAMGARTDSPIDATVWAFPAGALGYCLLAAVIDLLAGRGSLAFALYVPAATLGCGAALYWVLVGSGGIRKPKDVSRAALLADAPARSDLAELDRIAAMRDPVPRNYLITQAYHDLSVQLARVIPGPNANWCTFATWASRTAGESIRDEEVPGWALALLKAEGKLENALDAALHALGARGHVTQTVFDVARDTLARVREQIGDGNRKVYAELAPLFARLTACFTSPGVIDDAAFAALLGNLRPGSSAEGGQAPLRQAFEAYRDAAREPDASKRAQLMLVANVLIGLHEQTRLQPNIVAALEAPVDEEAEHGLLARLAKLLPSGVSAELRALLAPTGKAVLAFVRDVWCHIATSAAMHLDQPDGSVIALGEDPTHSLRQGYPPELRTPTLPALQQLIARYGAGPGEDCAATDWADLDQRMRLILDLFRTTQDDARMFQQPFTAKQRAAHAAALTGAPAGSPSASPAGTSG